MKECAERKRFDYVSCGCICDPKLIVKCDESEYCNALCKIIEHLSEQ